MKAVKLKELSINPGMEYQSTSYPGNGAYWVNGRQMIVVWNGTCYSSYMDLSLVEDAKEAQGGAGGVSESFVFALIEKTVELVKLQPARSVRRLDVDAAEFVATQMLAEKKRGQT